MVSVGLCGHAVSWSSFRVISHFHVLGEDLEAKNNGVVLPLPTPDLPTSVLFPARVSGVWVLPTRGASMLVPPCAGGLLLECLLGEGKESLTLE